MKKIAAYKEELLNGYESRNDDWSFADFERSFKDRRKNASYHDVKTVIIEAHRIGRWPNTVKRYITTNFKAHGNVSAELNDVASSVVAALSAAEKKELGL